VKKEKEREREREREREKKNQIETSYDIIFIQNLELCERAFYI